MSDIQSLIGRLGKVAGTHPEYKTEAYHFVLVALNFTINKLKKPRHVTGKELCYGIRDYALEQYGSMAQTVIEYWGITTTLDFGKIVFYLIDEGLMQKTEEDTVDDFKDVYAFDAAFSKKVDYDIE